MRLAFMASGRGSNMQSILDACQSGRLSAKPVLLICNNSEAGAFDRARKAGIKTHYLSSKTHDNSTKLDQVITETIEQENIDLIVLAGYMKKLGPVLLNRFADRIVNVHPSLLPKFGGQGMYGMNVHKAVISAGETLSGATIHLVNDEYDQGRILAQQSVRVDENDTAETLATKVLEIEHRLYPETLIKIQSGDIQL